MKAQIQEKRESKLKEKARIEREQRLKQEIFEFVYRPTIDELTAATHTTNDGASK